MTGATANNKTENDKINISETGRTEDGRTISSDRRLFVQMLAYGGCTDTALLIEALQKAGVPGVLYEDVNDPTGVGLIVYTERPDYLVEDLRVFLNQPPFIALTPKPEYTMLGRTYSLGYESDLEETLIGRPSRRLRDSDLAWGIWYPLRRSGSFESLPSREQNAILMEHGGVGHAFGKAGYAFDVRLACHGLDKNDNDFVIGLIGPELYPLSAAVQRMRKTKQTSLHLESLGPFFIGKAVWRAVASQ